MACEKIWLHQTMRQLTWMVMGAVVVAAAACGNPDAELMTPVAEETQVVSDASAPSPQQAREIPPIEVFDFTVEGVTPVVAVPDASQLILSGGCAAPSPLSIGFTSGTPNSGEYFGFAIESAEPVAQGQTGEIALPKITWDNGATAPKNLPDSNFKVPNRFEGSGSLVIAAHAGRGMGGSMSASVSGQISQRDSDQVGEIAVSFAINLACAD